MAKTKSKKSKNKIGRPTKMTQETVTKLEQAFALGCTDVEACAYADISRETLNNYQNKTPDFLDKKTRLKAKPILAARNTIVNRLKTDENVAKWFLERKLKKEFGTAPLIGDPDDGKIEIIVRKE